MTTDFPEGYYATVVDEEDYDRYADEHAAEHEVERQER